MSQKLTDLSQLTQLAAGDKLYIVDVSDTTDDAAGTGFYITADDLLFFGTSFPASPFTGQPFFRTDLGFDCYYNGTYWLTKNEYMISLPETTVSADNIFEYTWIGDTYNAYYTTQEIRTYVDTTNDGSNYWTVTVRSRAVDGSSNNTITSIDTSADSADTNIDHSETADTATPASYHGLPYFYAAKTGSPGDLTLTGTIKWRWIIT